MGVPRGGEVGQKRDLIPPESRSFQAHHYHHPGSTVKYTAHGLRQ